MKNVNRIMNVPLKIAITKIKHRNQPVKNLKMLVLHVSLTIIVSLNYASLRK